jgi:hypothetical protein
VALSCSANEHISLVVSVPQHRLAWVSCKLVDPSQREQPNPELPHYLTHDPAVLRPPRLEKHRVWGSFVPPKSVVRPVWFSRLGFWRRAPSFDPWV